LRIASVLVFMVISWIGLGYLLSDNINTHQTLAQVQQQVNQAVKDKNAIQDQLSKVNSDKNLLENQNDQFTQQIIMLQRQMKQLKNENQDLKDINSGMQKQLEETKNPNSQIGSLGGILPQSLMLAIFIPIFPVTLVASFAVYQFSRRHGGRKPSQENKPWRIASIDVTKAEMQQIVKMRRGKQ
jgi:hypothetical protein